MLPGGLGGFELVMGLLLSKAGATPGDAAVVIAVFRLSSLWLFNLIGLLFMAGWIATKGHHVFREQAPSV